MNKLHRINGANLGQTWARIRWNTQGSGAAFDRKKQFSLSSAMKASQKARTSALYHFWILTLMFPGAYCTDAWVNSPKRPMTIISSFNL
jgi:hypothetical protein